VICLVEDDWSVFSCRGECVRGEGSGHGEEAGKGLEVLLENDSFMIKHTWYDYR
jgi:hypothetical protein